MRRVFTALLGVLALTAAGTSARAAIYPPGPSGTCLDSVQVSDIQDLAATCHPATGDTVYGVSGIVTGFDPHATGFAIYVQSRRSGANGAPWTGIDVFTGGDNLKPPNPGTGWPGLAIGDSVHVRGRTEEFQGETEVVSFNGAFGSNKISVEKYSSGNSLPAFHVGTVQSLQELPTNPNAEQWEGCLVRANHLMRVGRTSLTGGLGTSNSFLVVNDVTCPASSPGPCDSMFIDGNTLSDPRYTPPPVGTKIEMVQGIYNQRTRGYRIQLRDGQDIVTATPPNLSDGFSVHADTLRVVFDRNVTQASAENVNNYSLGSLGTIHGATLVEPNVAHVAIGNDAAPHGTIESITVNGIVAAANGLAMTTPQGRSFYKGVLSIAEIQAPDPAFLGSPCEDRSRFAGAGSAAGQRLTYRGVVTGVFGSVYYQQDAGGGQRSGIASFAPIAPLAVGRKYMYVGAVQEFFNETEGTFNAYLRDEGPAAIPAPVLQTIAVLKDTLCDSPSPGLKAQTHRDTGEDYEGMLVRVEKVRITENRNPGQSFFIAGPCCAFPDTMLVSIPGGSPVTFDPDSAHTVNVQGILRFSFGTFRIYPRSNADITDLGLNVDVPRTAPGQVSFAVYPNPARTATLAFKLPQAEEVELAVFDLSGRRVATLHRGRLPAGEFSRRWSGRDDAGHALGAGVYFYRLKVGDRVFTQRGVKLD